jgi:SAM-dependent methyltransferase
VRENVRAFVDDVAATIDLPGPIFEFGSFQVEGQESLIDLRPLFPGREFVGCDMRDGPGVDRIEDLRGLTMADGSVGTALSLDTFEHVADCQTAIAEIHRVLQPGGVVVLSSVMFFPIHEHPSDYWRFTPFAFELLLEKFESVLVIGQGHELLPHTILGVGIKGPAADGVFDALRARHTTDFRPAGLHVAIGPMALRPMELLRLAGTQLGSQAIHRLRRRRS